MERLIKSLLIVPFALFASSAMAVPELQVGDADGGTCESYDNITEDCIVGATFSVTSDAAGTGYIVFGAVPKTAIDTFNIAPTGDEGALALADSGYGAPPFEDSNSLPGHGIFDTYVEVYAVNFNTQGEVCNTDPVDATDCKQDWYIEYIDINVASLTGGLHIDLFRCTSGSVEGGDCQIESGTDFAPFSHDGTYVPVPAAVWLFGSGLLGLVAVARRRKNA